MYFKKKKIIHIVKVHSNSALNYKHIAFSHASILFYGFCVK